MAQAMSAFSPETSRGTSWHGYCRARCAMSSRLHLVFAVPILVLVACGGSVERVPDPNGAGGGSAANGSSSSSSSSSGGSSGGDRVCTLAPACDQGDRSFASPDAACIEIAGVSCYERTACGATIWCQHTDTSCKALPTCKPGWFQTAKGCEPDSNCEKVTLCGTTIICQEMCEGPQPLCDDGDREVGGPSGCPSDASCYSRSNGCGFTIWCTDG
jgi:hypothetical protein